MWPRKVLLDLLEIEHPVIQATMGGASTPAMVIAKSMTRLISEAQNALKANSGKSSKCTPSPGSS